MHLCLECAQTLSFTAAFVTEHVLQLQVQTVGAGDGTSQAVRGVDSCPSRNRQKSSVLGLILSSAPHHPQQRHTAQCRPHHRAPAEVGVGRVGYACLEAAVLQPPPCTASGPKPNQAQVDRSHFACCANRTRSHRGACPLQLGVHDAHWAPSGPQAPRGSPSNLVCFKMGSQMAPDWHRVPRGPVQPSLTSSHAKGV